MYHSELFKLKSVKKFWQRGGRVVSDPAAPLEGPGFDFRMEGVVFSS